MTDETKTANEPPLDCRVMHEELCLEEDGDIGIDWVTPERDVLSLSLRADGRIAYAVRLADGSGKCGEMHIALEAFTVLRKLVHNVKCTS
jgi:hypothetical protein